MTKSAKKKPRHKGRKRHTVMTARERRALDDPIVGTRPGAIPVRGIGRNGWGATPEEEEGTVVYSMGSSFTGPETSITTTTTTRPHVAGRESEDSDDSTQPGAVAVEGGGSPRRRVNSRSSPEGREEADTNAAHHVEATVVEDGGVTREARERIVAETRRQLIEEAGEAQVVVTVHNTTSTIQKDPRESVPQYVLRHKKIACAICALLVLLIIIVVTVVLIIEGGGAETSPITTTTNPSTTEPPCTTFCITTSITSNSLDWCPSGTTTMSFSDNFTTQSKDDAASSVISGLENINKIIRVEVFRAQYFWYANSDPAVSKIRVTYHLKDGREIAVTRGQHTEQQPQGTLNITEGVYLTKVNVKSSPNFNVIDSLEFCLSDGSCYGPWGGPRGDQEEVLHKENSVIKAFFGEVADSEGLWIETLGCHYETCVDI